MRNTIIVMLMFTMLAGCTDDDLSEATVAFSNGDGNDMERAACEDGDATLSGAGTVHAGAVTVTVMDGSGNEVFSNAYDDAMDVEGEALSGAGGEWTLRAARSSSFDGDYSFSLVCS